MRAGPGDQQDPAEHDEGGNNFHLKLERLFPAADVKGNADKDEYYGKRHDRHYGLDAHNLFISSIRFSIRRCR